MHGALASLGGLGRPWGASNFLHCAITVRNSGRNPACGYQRALEADVQQSPEKRSNVAPEHRICCYAPLLDVKKEFSVRLAPPSEDREV